ncbi:MAG: hypothetical protein ACJATP_001154 [Candidatus Azotimanducaceae bacterium]|jgi:hypothetical protein
MNTDNRPHVFFHYVLLGPRAYSLSLGCAIAARDHAGNTKVNLIENFSQLNLYNFSKGRTAPADNSQRTSGLQPTQPLTNTGTTQHVAK